jgi:hypothetical protein
MTSEPDLHRVSDDYRVLPLQALPCSRAPHCMWPHRELCLKPKEPPELPSGLGASFAAARVRCAAPATRDAAERTAEWPQTDLQRLPSLFHRSDCLASRVLHLQTR